MNSLVKLKEVISERKEFQLERLILFSDAVFAIAITLLVIEMKVPALKEMTAHDLKDALIEKIPEFFGFVISFAVIGQFWINHHRLFGYVTGYTTNLMWMNLHMLFWIVLVPFTSGLNSRYGGLDEVWMIYCFNLFMIAMSGYFMARYVNNPKRNLSAIANMPEVKKLSYIRSMCIALIFLLGALLCLFNTYLTSRAARIIFLLIPISLSLSNRLVGRTGAGDTSQRETDQSES